MPWGATTDGETDIDADTDAMSESDFEVASTINGGHNPGESTLFLPGDTVFWLPYALSESFVSIRTVVLACRSSC